MRMGLRWWCAGTSIALDIFKYEPFLRSQIRHHISLQRRHPLLTTCCRVVEFQALVELKVQLQEGETKFLHPELSGLQVCCLSVYNPKALPTSCDTDRAGRLGTGSRC